MAHALSLGNGGDVRITPGIPDKDGFNVTRSF